MRKVTDGEDKENNTKGNHCCLFPEYCHHQSGPCQEQLRHIGIFTCLVVDNHNQRENWTITEIIVSLGWFSGEYLGVVAVKTIHRYYVGRLHNME